MLFKASVQVLPSSAYAAILYFIKLRFHLFRVFCSNLDCLHSSNRYLKVLQ
jgi:hypothetical protein